MSSFSSSTGEYHRRSTRSPILQTATSNRPGSSSLSRPQWPWTSTRSSAYNFPSTNTSTPTQLPSTPQMQTVNATESTWPPQNNQVHAQGMNQPEEAATRQWTFTAFEWTIRNVSALRDYLEQTPSLLEANAAESTTSEDQIPEVLKQSPMIGENGENKFKVEIGRSLVPEEQGVTPTSPNPLRNNMNTSTASPLIRLQTLSLYITSLFLDFAHPEYEFCTAIMVAIKSHEDRAGERGARSEWLWESWEREFVFRKDAEFWECQLPPLSTLLSHPRIAAQDSLVLCIQIHSPIGFYPQFPHAYYVPRDLLSGLEDSLDNPHTGDVRFIALERLPADEIESATANPSRRSSASSFTLQSRFSRVVARKRTLYAHSDILKRRSEYFATMLSSTFAESHASQTNDARKVHDVIVSEADFITVYWLLKWIYADWIMFKEEDDPREVMDGMAGGWSVNSLRPPTISGSGEWDWRAIRSRGSRREGSGSESPESREEEDDAMSRAARSVRSSSSIGTAATHISEVDGQAKVPYNTHPLTTPGGRGGAPGPSSSSRGRASVVGSRTGGGTASLAPVSRRPGAPPSVTGNSKALGMTTSGASQQATSHVMDNTASSASAYKALPPSPRASLSPRILQQQQQQQSRQLPNNNLASGDPHVHPTPELPPASALAIYQVSHRYAIPGLSTLALEHMMSTITPKSAFPLLLATHLWEDLHALVEDFIVEHFDIVSRCEAFDLCCQEVAAGEWGPEGGKTLANLFRRLAAPNNLRYGRA
ncbi:hypothetical protein FRB94_000288 [Tulasnella sp. JGI-2019a]|nr:hypothetical protein FRB93_003222 [Tulasnella sp. JGI-2019a]KAG9006877.1 hypothetical protein FRB94_000288 [Tulasnella sp. JGI-2019a]